MTQVSLYHYIVLHFSPFFATDAMQVSETTKLSWVIQRVGHQYLI